MSLLNEDLMNTNLDVPEGEIKLDGVTDPVYADAINVHEKKKEQVEDTLKEKELPTNLSILISIWHKNYDNPYNLPEFIFDDHSDPELQKIPHCPAVDEHGHETGITCASCKKCVYAKKGDKIAVYEH